MPKDTRKRRMLGVQFLRFSEAGEKFEGALIDRMPMEFPNGMSYQYTFENAQGKFKKNGTVQIDEALADVEMGTVVEMVFLGTERTMAGHEVERYEISALE